MLSNCGVPQGSVLGPILYSLLVLSSQKANLMGRYYTFADDTALVYSGTNQENLEFMVNEDLKYYHKWLLQNKLKLHLDKTVYMTLQQRNSEQQNITVQINNTKLKKLQKTKYLGLIVDDKLNWDSHIEHIIKNKLVPMIGVLYRCSNFLNNKNRNLIYNAYILSNLQYLIKIWGSCNSTNFQKAQVLLNKAVKILYQLPYRTHTHLLCHSINPLKYII